MGGLESELEDLYRRRNGAFQVMLASVTGSVESACDVVQEAFARALRDQNGFRGEGSLEAWVWRIAFRVAIGSKGSRELVVDEVPEVAFADESRDLTLAAAVRELPPQRRLAALPAQPPHPSMAKCWESPKELSRRRCHRHTGNLHATFRRTR